MSSSLREFSDGILETCVTWEETERRMREALKTTARFGPNKSVVHIGEGNGFMSRIGLITCDWIEKKDGEVLPERFALKIASGIASKALDVKPTDEHKDLPETEVSEWLKEDMIRIAHNLEVEVYNFITAMNENVAMPKCYYTTPFTDKNKNAGCIALEFMENSKINHIYDSFTVDQIRQIARQLGKIQALSVIHGIDKKYQFRISDLLKDFWSNFSEELIIKMISAFKTIDQGMSECVDGVIKLTPAYMGTNLSSFIIHQMGVKPVIVNGDLWSANVLVDSENGDVKALIDWQAGHQGSGVEDLLRIMFSGLSSKDRRDNMKSLLDEMYTSMENNLGSTTAPYTREEMHEMADHLLPHCGFFFVAPGGMMIQLISAPELSDEEKKRRKDVLFDKIRGICEDIVTYHEKNKLYNRNFKFIYE